MTENNLHPWDCRETFGSQEFYAEPGQAHLCQWPLKLSLVSSLSPYYHKAHLIVAADCSAFSYYNFHSALLKGRVLAIGCPHLESSLGEKLEEIVRLNDIQSIAVVRMDAPCCRPLTDAVFDAVRKSKKDIPIQYTTIFAEGENVNE